MAITFYSGIEAGTMLEWASVSGTQQVSTTQKNTGAYAFRAYPTASTGYADNGLADGAMDRGSLWLYIASAPSASCRIVGDGVGAALYLSVARVSGLVDSYDPNNNNQTSIYGTNWVAQTFLATTTYTIKGVSILSYAVGSPGTTTISIQAVDGNGKPDGTDLCSGTRSSMAGTPTTWNDFTLGNGATLTSGTTYAIVVRATSGNSSNYVLWRAQSLPSNGYTDGSGGTTTDSGANWTLSSWDYGFKTYNSGGNFVDYYTAATSRTNGTIDIPPQGWHRISWATDGSTFKTYINGVQDISNAVTVDEVADGLVGVITTATADLYFDDIVFDNTSSTADLGDIRVQLAQPNAAGTYTGFTTVVPSGTHYTTYDDNAGSLNDADYVAETGKTVLRDTAGLESCAQAGLGASDTINAVQIWARIRGDNVDPTAGISVRDNGTDYETLSVLSDVSMAWKSVLYTTMPNGGAAWSQARFDALEAGMYHGGDSDDSYMTCLMVMVAFTPDVGGIVDISNTPTNYAFGLLAASATPSTGLDYFTITNNSGFAINISISGVNMTGGVGWTLADDGTPGTNIVAIKAGLEGGSYNIIVKKTPPYNTLKSGLADGATQKFGLQMLAPTAFTDGVAKTGTVTVTGVAA